MINVTLVRYALGVAALIIVAGSFGIAALTLRRWFLPELGGAVARLAEAVIGLAVLTLLLQLLGAVGWFQSAPILIGSVLVAAAATAAARVAGATGRSRVSYDFDGVAVAVAAVAGAAVVVEWAVPTIQAYDVGIRSFDSLWYHLPWAASFAQTGHITPLRFTDVEYLTAFYPATAELFHGVGIVLLARDTLSPVLNILWLGLVLLAAYCVGRPRGVGALSAAGAAVAMATPMMRFSQPGSAANDVVGIFFLLAATALLLNAFETDTAALGVLAGAAVGLAIAVKLSMIVPALALVLAAILAAPAGRRRVAAVTWVLPLLVTASFWYVRNLFAVGNPLPWRGALGLPTPAPALQAHTAFTVAHYLGNGHVIRRFLEPGLAAGLGPWWQAIIAAALIGPLVCVLTGPELRVRMLGLVALVALAAYVLTPESAAGPPGQPLGFAFNLRYAAPALTLCLTVLPLARPLHGRWRRRCALAVLVVLLVSVLAEPHLWPSARVPVAILVGAAALLVLAVAHSAPRRGALAGLAAVAVLAALGGYFLQRHYLAGRYVYQPGVSSLARVWALFRRIHHARVGVVGTFGGFFSYPLFGVDLSNRVSYVAQRGSHGSFTAIRSCARWRAAVNAGGYRYLVTTPARDPWHPTVLSRSPESGWTARSRDVDVVYSERALGQVIRVYRLHGRLDPACHPNR